METNQKRITILTVGEIADLYDCPIFNATEREEYFALDDEILRVINALDKLETKLYLMLLIGYFRAKPVVPQFTLKTAKQDVDYLCRIYFPDKKPKYGAVIQSTRTKLVHKMLALLDFERFDRQKHQGALIIRLQDVATIYSDPRYIFDEYLAFFGQKRVALTGYSTVQKCITEVLTAERQRTESVFSQHIADTTLQRLRAILHSKGLLNKLSSYKGAAKDFSPSELAIELQTHDTIKPIYPEIKMLVEQLGLSQGNLNYYADIVKHRSIYKLRRYTEPQNLLYLACYLYFRYRETNDILVTAFIYLVGKHIEAAKAFAHQSIADEIETVRNKLQYAGKVLHMVADEEGITGTIRLNKFRNQAYAVLTKEEILAVGQHFTKNDFDLTHYEWQYTDKQVRKTANSLRKLFIAIDIQCDDDQPMLSKQIQMAKLELQRDGKITFMDQRFIQNKDRPYLQDGDDVNPQRFEFYLYHRVYKLLDKNQIYVTESDANKRLEDDLITPVDWQQKPLIIENTGLERLKQPIRQTLDELDVLLQQRMEHVAHQINSNANAFVKRQPGSQRLAWTLANKRWKDDVENPVYSQIKHMDIVDIMRHVNRKTHFLDEFKALTTRKRSVKPNDEDVYACMLADGSNYGLHGIAAASDRSLAVLRGVNDAFVRPENLDNANDAIANATAKLAIFKHYTINEVAPFGSIDGQKHSCRIKTFKARFSAKYFRKGKGVSALTLVSNHVPLNTTVISPNEYEGHYAFDLLYNNSSDIQPKTLATDSHGVNSVNFAILDIFGYQFTPRYAKFKHIFFEQFEVEYGEQITLHMKVPINGKLIEQEWDEIQRIMCSLSRKTTTQSTVVKKLANTKRSSRTLKALHEYDRLIKCLYLLEYIDNATLRHFIQQALNRGEAYHQLRRAIASISGNQFRGGSDYQIEQWNGCARLIANCIIYYNSELLSGLITRFEKLDKPLVVEMLSNLSPVAWAHILMSGQYTFGNRTTMIDIESLLKDIEVIAEDTLDATIAA